jgi:hypothetical protein
MKGLGSALWGVEVGLNRSYELEDRTEHPTAYGLLGELSEPTLRQVELRARRGREMEVEPGGLASQAWTLSWPRVP